jgi:hypothetical protein
VLRLTVVGPVLPDHDSTRSQLLPFQLLSTSSDTGPGSLSAERAAGPACVGRGCAALDRSALRTVASPSSPVDERPCCHSNRDRTAGGAGAGFGSAIGREGSPALGSSASARSAPSAPTTVADRARRIPTVTVRPSLLALFIGAPLRSKIRRVAAAPRRRFDSVAVLGSGMGGRRAWTRADQDLTREGRRHTDPARRTFTSPSTTGAVSWGGPYSWYTPGVAESMPGWRPFRSILGRWPLARGHLPPGVR